LSRFRPRELSNLSMSIDMANYDCWIPRYPKLPSSWKAPLSFHRCPRSRTAFSARTAYLAKRHTGEIVASTSSQKKASLISVQQAADHIVVKNRQLLKSYNKSLKKFAKELTNHSNYCWCRWRTTVCFYNMGSWVIHSV
jgi:hypothetical protein